MQSSMLAGSLIRYATPPAGPDMGPGSKGPCLCPMCTAFAVTVPTWLSTNPASSPAMESNGFNLYRPRGTTGSRYEDSTITAESLEMAEVDRA
jgi:hypothetical protein